MAKIHQARSGEQLTPVIDGIEANPGTHFAFEDSAHVRSGRTSVDELVLEDSAPRAANSDDLGRSSRAVDEHGHGLYHDPIKRRRGVGESLDIPSLDVDFITEPSGGDPNLGLLDHSRIDINGRYAAAETLSEQQRGSAYATPHVEHFLVRSKVGQGNQFSCRTSAAGVDDRLPDGGHQSIRIEAPDLLVAQRDRVGPSHNKLTSSYDVGNPIR